VRSAALALAMLVGCARVREAVDAGAPLDGCKSETRDGATTWDCGGGFLAMEATIDHVASKDEIDDNLQAFRAELIKESKTLDLNEHPRVIRGESHPAEVLHLDLPERGRFVAMIVVVRRAKSTRVITCSARAADSARCDAVLEHLGGRAMDAP